MSIICGVQIVVMHCVIDEKFCPWWLGLQGWKQSEKYHCKLILFEFLKKNPDIFFFLIQQSDKALLALKRGTETLNSLKTCSKASTVIQNLYIQRPLLVIVGSNADWREAN